MCASEASGRWTGNKEFTKHVHNIYTYSTLTVSAELEEKAEAAALPTGTPKIGAATLTCE
jgi:hypothetical protein